jgi:hypothetical protein
MDDDERRLTGDEADEQPSRESVDVARRRDELLAHARSVRKRQKATEGGDADPLVRARRSAARLRDLRP